MYFTAPVYAQRQYAASDSLYKINAVAKTKGVYKQSPRPLYDMLMQYLPSPAPEKPSDVLKRLEDRQRTKQEGAQRSASKGLLAADPNAERKTGLRPVPNPFDAGAKAKPYNPSNQFREPGYNSDYFPPKALSASEQQPWRERHAAMVNAYKPLSATGGTLLRTM